MLEMMKDLNYVPNNATEKRTEQRCFGVILAPFSS